MWQRLSKAAHLVAIDLPGFGHSEGRKDLFTTSAMGGFIVQVVEEFELERPHAVGPDIGTASLLFAVAKHPGLLRRVVVGGGTAAVPIQVGSLLKEIIAAPNLEPFRSMDPRTTVESVLTYVQRYKLPDHVREDFLSSDEGDRFSESLRILQAYRTDLPVLATLLPKIQTPVQIINGAHDSGVLPLNAEYLHEKLPHSKLDMLDTDHFARADAADDYATLVTDWWKGGYQRL
jgi:pimeloyl-ACP methyl ester carboxylesterase